MAESSAASNNGKKRLGYWDITKGVAILIVIIGHTANIPIELRNFIFSIHMPLFFVANAYFIKEYNVTKTLKRSSRSLLLPYAVTCILSAYLAAEKHADIATNVEIFKKRFIDMFVGMSKISDKFTEFQSVWLVWFVICLFAARMIYVTVMKICSKVHFMLGIIPVAALAVAGYLIGTGYAFMPWSFDVALFALPLMFVGDNSRKAVEKFGGKKYFKPVYYAAAAMSLGGWIILVNKGYVIEMATRKYPGEYLCLITALLGIFAVVALSRILERFTKYISAFLMWCGKNSMVILIIHCLEMRFFKWNDHVYCHLPFVVAGNFTRTWIVKLTVILLYSFIITKVIGFIKADRADAEYGDASNAGAQKGEEIGKGIA